MRLPGAVVEPGKIHVSPTGVDTEVYSPSVDGGPVRRRLGLDSMTVIGFVGTFRQVAWCCGACRSLRASSRFGDPELRDNTRLLMVGDRG